MKPQLLFIAFIFGIGWAIGMVDSENSEGSWNGDREFGHRNFGPELGEGIWTKMSKHLDVGQRDDDIQERYNWLRYKNIV